ncbi:hypothetical protein ACU686_13460, partial [Yinghuangia aomiensis]
MGKPYPSNHFTHPGIDCALAPRAAAGLTGGRRRAPPNSAWPHRCCGPSPNLVPTKCGRRAATMRSSAALHRRPRTARRQRTWSCTSTTSPTTRPPTRGCLRPLAERIDLVADERATRLFPTAFAAVLRVTTHSRARARTPGGFVARTPAARCRAPTSCTSSASTPPGCCPLNTPAELVDTFAGMAQPNGDFADVMKLVRTTPETSPRDHPAAVPVTSCP